MAPGGDKIKRRVEVAGADGHPATRFDVESPSTSAWGTSQALVGRHAGECVERLKEPRPVARDHARKHAHPKRR